MSRRRLRPLRVLRALRLSRWPTVGSVVALALFFAGQLLGLPTLPLGMLLAVPLLIGTIGLGWHAGMAMLPVGLGLLLLGQGLRGEAGGWTLYATTLAVAVLSVATGHSLFTLWRRTEQRAHRSARRALLLSEATADLQGIEERGELFRTLPQLLGDILDFGHAEVFVPVDDGLELAAAYRWNIPAGFRVPLDSVTGRALSERRVQYVADTERLPHFLAAPNAPRTRSELALPLQVGERVAAVFNIEHPDVDGFSRRDRNTLQALARIGEAALARITDTEELQRRHDEQRQIAELTRRLTRAESAHQAAVWALEALRDALGLDTGMVLTLDRGRFRPLVVSGALPGPLTAALERGLDRHRGEVGRTWEGKRERFIEDYQRHPDADVEYRALGARGLLYAPILNPVGEALALVQLADFGTPHPFPEHERRLVRIVTDTLGVVFQREALHRQLAELLEVVRSLAQTDDPDQLYARAVEAAVRLIPGAESGSILVREGATFRFAAAEGFATDALRELPALSEEGQLIWYGGDREAFTAGRPRLLVGDGIAASSSASTEADGAELGEEARLHDLRANICVPITTNREVVGILNLDSLTA
jgi:GAF domain-containing protein